MTYVYDEQGRLQTKELVNDPDVHYVYDSKGQVEEIRVGDDPNAPDTEVTRFDYDAQGRLTGRKDPDAPTFTNAAGEEFTIAYTYDAAGNITSVETAAGKTEYTYDAWNRLKTVKQDSDTEATEYVYDAAGNLIQTTFPNGVVETREYDDLNRLETITTTDTQGDGDASNDLVLARSEYQLNDAGHRMQVIQSLWNEAAQTLESETTNYTYDELYRLLEVQTVGSDGVSYTYDDAGNRASMQVGDTQTTYVYDANDQLDKVMVGEQVTVDYDYDPDGNLIREAVTGGDTLIYTWDDQNRLVAVAKEGEAPFVTYEYDDDNIRVSQTVDGETTEFVVDKNRAYAQVLAEYIGSQLIEEYVYGWDLIEQTDGTTGDEAFFGVDGLGSTVVLTDENGDVVQTYEYDEFGALADAPTDLETDYLFAGEQFDESLGDYYLRQRYYDPSVGRFTRRDTWEGRLAEPITLNKFVYGNSNPVSYIDPSGLSPLAEINSKFVLENTLTSLAFSVPTRTLEAVKDFQAGASLAKIAGSFAFGLAFDVGVGLGVGVTANRLLGIAASTRLIRLRQAGQAAALTTQTFRAANSVWSIRSAVERGREIEQFILGRPANIPVWNFPTIDDYDSFTGVATSIKSLDLTAKTYQNPKRMVAQIDSYAKKLSKFNGRTYGGVNVPSPSQRVLYIAIEDGAMSRAQAVAMTDFLESARNLYPNVNIVLHPVP
ncbi:MAG: RHS repeat-associated core domain-containing protein [Spirulinaceae cyanobacterium]